MSTFKYYSFLYRGIYMPIVFKNDQAASYFSNIYKNIVKESKVIVAGNPYGEIFYQNQDDTWGKSSIDYTLEGTNEITTIYRTTDNKLLYGAGLNLLQSSDGVTINNKNSSSMYGSSIYFIRDSLDSNYFVYINDDNSYLVNKDTFDVTKSTVTKYPNTPGSDPVFHKIENFVCASNAFQTVFKLNDDNSFTKLIELSYNVVDNDSGEKLRDLVSFKNNWYAAISTQNLIHAAGLTSSDSNWTKTEIINDSTMSFTRIDANNEILVVAGNYLYTNGIKICASQDGLIWSTVLEDNECREIYNCRYINDTFYVLSDHSTIFTSKNGLNWTKNKLSDTNTKLLCIC